MYLRLGKPSYELGIDMSKKSAAMLGIIADSLLKASETVKVPSGSQQRSLWAKCCDKNWPCGDEEHCSMASNCKERAERKAKEESDE